MTATAILATVATKTCTKCGDVLPVTDFPFHSKVGGVRRTYCKKCKLAAGVAHHAANREAINAKKKAYMAANPGIRKEKSRAYYYANHAEQKAKRDLWRSENLERLRLATSAWRANNPEKQKASEDAWRAANPGIGRVIASNRRFRKQANGGELSKDIGLKLLALQDGKCACCGEVLGDDYHLDHIMPLVLGGRNSDENMQLLTPLCNLRKGAMHPDEYMRKRRAELNAT